MVGGDEAGEESGALLWDRPQEVREDRHSVSRLQAGVSSLLEESRHHVVIRTQVECGQSGLVESIEVGSVAEEDGERVDRAVEAGVVESRPPLTVGQVYDIVMRGEEVLHQLVVVSLSSQVEGGSLQ